MSGIGSGVDHDHLRRFFERRGRVAAQWRAILRSLYDLRISADYEHQARNPVTTDAQVATAEALRLLAGQGQVVGAAYSQRGKHDMEHKTRVLPGDHLVDETATSGPKPLNARG